MAISKDEVKYIANLARLGLTEPEVEHFREQLGDILGYVDKLKKVDVSGMSPMAHVLDIKNIYRPDNISPSIAPEKILKYAPQHEGSFFKVPKVIE
ncbi:MAG TPA: Asp-tRNA(Asn)/Glu-tRNA(Gln) amidotransferase GatCAB subunit C [Candidatus Omnitrophica bacterium]|nr:Asp-tRNA(Asn)/Glu-tRNA(Gln) amidotransferase GatCAB subunit C [Candidatus Omnitrophota bacterium]